MEKRGVCVPTERVSLDTGAFRVIDDGMAGHVQVIRCKRCKRRFYASEDKCPECGHKSARGWLKISSIVLCIALAITAGAMFAIFLMKQTTKLERLPEPAGTN